MNRKDRRSGKPPAGKGGDAAPTVAALFAAALAAHRAGRLPEAEQAYRAVLARDPGHLATLRNVGVLGLQIGHAAMAADALAKALAREDAAPETHYNMAIALEGLRRMPDAIAHYRRAAALKPDYAEALMNLGNALARAGARGEAAACYRRVIALRPSSAEAMSNLGNVLAQDGSLGEAAEQYRHALALAPDLVEALVDLGTVLARLGQPAEALAHYRRALALDPGAVDAHVNIANLLADEGALEAAATALRQALALRPDHARAHNNLGTLRMQDGDVAGALAYYERALALDPGFAEAHVGLGLARMAQGELDTAEHCFRRALALRPDLIDAHNALARAALAAGQPAQAIAALRRALAVRETAETKALLVQCLRAISFGSGDAGLRELVVRALAEPWAQPDDVSPVAAGLLKREAAVRRALAHVDESWPARFAVPLADVAGDLIAVLGDDLLRTVLEVARILDADLERLLTATRFALLEAATAGQGAAFGADSLAFCCALARQCFNNEYAFAQSEAELAATERLREEVVAALACGAAVAELDLALVGCYFPLHQIAPPEIWRAGAWSAPVSALLRVQALEVEEERRERAAILPLTAIDDPVSRRVREQYEENPYPRWGKSPPPVAATTLPGYLRAQFPTAEIADPGRGAAIDILIAGCGTNQAVRTAQRFPRAKVLAVDLSLTSLAYSRYKSRELGLTNVEYAQADILQLPALDRRFDLIEASGVLHHMADPFLGWRTLVDLLRPQGFMQVALYSEAARRPLASARAFIAAHGYVASAGDIRRFRADVMNSRDASLTGIAAFADFYSISACRDLLFHVQEHRLTLPAIQAFLDENNLRFIGFELDPALRQLYARQFPADPTMTDLVSWDRFEAREPRAFLGMYQFWVQQRAG